MNPKTNFNGPLMAR